METTKRDLAYWKGRVQDCAQIEQSYKEQAGEYGRAKRKAQRKVAKIEKWLRMAVAVVLLGLVALFAGCHTVYGVGTDLTAVTEPYITD